MLIKVCSLIWTLLSIFINSLIALKTFLWDIVNSLMMLKFSNYSVTTTIPTWLKDLGSTLGSLSLTWLLTWSTCNTFEIFYLLILYTSNGYLKKTQRYYAGTSHLIHTSSLRFFISSSVSIRDKLLNIDRLCTIWARCVWVKLWLCLHWIFWGQL